MKSKSFYRNRCEQLSLAYLLITEEGEIKNFRQQHRWHLKKVVKLIAQDVDVEENPSALCRLVLEHS